VQRHLHYQEVGAFPTISCRLSHWRNAQKTVCFFAKKLKKDVSFIIYHAFIISETNSLPVTYKEMTNETPKTKIAGRRHS